MATKPPPGPMSPSLSICLDNAPSPMATVEGAMHVVRYINPAFCRLINKISDEVLGKPLSTVLPELDECPALLSRVYRTGKPASYMHQEHSIPRSIFSSYSGWPLMDEGRTMGVMMQVIEGEPLYAMTLAMNEALLLGSLRQHELTEAADASNIQLQTEVDDRKEREHDALMMTREVSHRIKNNLQIVANLIAYEARRVAAPCVQGYIDMQARIRAIAELYDLMFQSSRGRAIPVTAYLEEIAGAMSASLLGDTSDIKIEVEGEALDIDPGCAVSFGLLVNELVTNAVKHAFPDGIGRVVLRVQRTGDQFELTVTDNGVGMKDSTPANMAETHGADYIAIFVRQLGGTISVPGPAGVGTTVRIRLPMLATSQAVQTA